MPFRISSICDNWFANLSDQEPLKRKFDYYYLCALLGLAMPRKGKLSTDAKEFVDEFIIPYRPYQRQLIGLLLVTHVHELGIGLDERKAVTDQILQLVAPTRAAQLTEEGFALLNAYCQGGFEELSENLDKPHKMVFFLQKYQEILDEKMRSNPLWADAFKKERDLAM